MTARRSYANRRGVGRRKLYDTRVALPLRRETVGRIDAVLRPRETRLDLIRAAIDDEVRRRERSRTRSAEADPSDDTDEQPRIVE